MNPPPSPLDSPSSDQHLQLPSIKIHHHHPSPRNRHHHHSPVTTPTPTAGARRKIAVAVDLSDESSYAVRWTVENYIRPGDAVIILHVSPTSGLLGADWGPLNHSSPSPSSSSSSSSSGHHANKHKHNNSNSNSSCVNNNTNNNGDEDQLLKKQQEDFDAFTAAKVADFAKPLKEANVPYKIHIVKDHDMTERLCLEVERLGLSAVILGSRGLGAEKQGTDGTLGSVSNYCLNHCVCPVVVVRDEKDGLREGEESAKPDNSKDGGVSSLLAPKKA